MISRECIKAIIAGQPADRCGLWLGNPLADTWPRLHGDFGTSTEEELRVKLQDDFRWIWPMFAVKRITRPRQIVIPSHEAILPNVPPANVAALAEAAIEDMERGLRGLRSQRVL